MAEERRVEPGQRVSGALSSRTINTMIELVRGQRLQRLGPEGGAWPGDALPRGLEVLVRNDTGEFQAAGNVLAIDQGTPVDPADEPGEFELRPLFSGAVPFSSSDVVAVLRDGADDGQVVPAVLRGLAVVLLDVTDATHAFGAPVAGDSDQMKSATAGHPILWTETGGTGSQYGVVLLDAQPAAAAAAAVPYDSQLLPADFTLGSVAFQNTGLSVTLGAQGTYLFHGNVGWEVTAVGGAGDEGIMVQLADSASVFAGHDHRLVTKKGVQVGEGGEAAFHEVITSVGDGRTVRLNAQHTGTNTTKLLSYTGASHPHTRLTVVKLG